MSTEKQPIPNAGEIIERFGGIRPMAAKINAAVTTVQGWKKRDVIPANRLDQVVNAAQTHDIDVSDLIAGAVAVNSNESKAEETVPAQPSEPKAEKKLPRPEAKPSKDKVEEESQKQETIIPATPQSWDDVPASQPKRTTTGQEEIMAAIEAKNRQTLARSAWIAVLLILLAGLVVYVLLSPTIEQRQTEQTSLIEQQSQEIKNLKAEVEEVNSRTSFVGNLMPDGMQAELQERMDSLQTQARNIQNTVNQLSEQASAISSGFLGPEAGPISQRLEMLEEKMAELSVSGNFGGVVDRIKALEDSFAGQEQLRNSVEELRNMMTGSNGSDQSLNEDLADVQNTNGGSALSETLQGVSGNDLKAAAMLITFSQLRNSLNRQAPFEQDLALMEKLVSEDNIELRGAIDRLAPHADGGVLSAAGLSNEFKGLTGDIVESSLKGEELSITEKAKARLSNLIEVKKDGELIGATETQKTVSKAQQLLDEGNIQGAIAELQTLDGEAAQTAQPFIERAEVALLAERVQQMLGEDILSRLQGQIPALQGMSQNGTMPERGFSDLIPDMDIPQIEGAQELNMDEIKRNLKEAVPNIGAQEVITDEESGVTILPRQQGFKGFSAGE